MSVLTSVAFANPSLLHTCPLKSKLAVLSIPSH